MGTASVASSSSTASTFSFGSSSGDPPTTSDKTGSVVRKINNTEKSGFVSSSSLSPTMASPVPKTPPASPVINISTGKNDSPNKKDSEVSKQISTSKKEKDVKKEASPDLIEGVKPEKTLPEADTKP